MKSLLFHSRRATRLGSATTAVSAHPPSHDSCNYITLYRHMLYTILERRHKEAPAYHFEDLVSTEALIYGIWVEGK